MYKRQLEQNSHISFCVKQLQEAGARGDIQTYEKSLDALEYGICRAENAKETAEEIWKIKEMIIRISGHVWTIGEQIDKDSKTIAEFSESKENLQREIRELEIKGREIPKSGLLNIQKSAGNKVSGDKLILNAKKDAALRMKEEIDNRKKQSAVNLQIKNGYNDQIRKLEQTAAQILLGNFSTDDYEIDTIAEKFQQNLLANMEAVQRGKDSADQVRKIMEETGSRVESQMDQQEIERRYRLLIEEEMEEKKNLLTYAGLKALEDELHDLKVVKRKEVAQKIKEAREQGDLSENAEYDAAKDEQRDIEARIEQIEKILKNAEVVVEDEVDLDKINVGCVVKVLDVEFDEEEEFKLVGSSEADSLNGKISNESPVGKALIGARVGDTIQVETQAGVIEYKVLEIQRSK